MIDEIHKLQMELEAARTERDEARAELKGWLETHPPSICSAHQVLDLACPLCNHAVYKNEQAQAACAEMRSVLSEMQHVETQPDRLSRIDHALSAAAGKGWMSAEEHKARMGQLQRELVAVCWKHV